MSKSSDGTLPLLSRIVALITLIIPYNWILRSKKIDSLRVVDWGCVEGAESPFGFDALTTNPLLLLGNLAGYRAHNRLTKVLSRYINVVSSVIAVLRCTGHVHSVIRCARIRDAPTSHRVQSNSHAKKVLSILRDYLHLSHYDWVGMTSRHARSSVVG